MSSVLKPIRAVLHYLLLAPLIGFGFLSIIATGGGGGGSGNSGTLGTTGLTYVGNTSAAAITPTNAAVLVTNILGNSAAATSVTTTFAVEEVSVTRSSTGVLTLVRRLSGDVRDLLDTSPDVGTSGLQTIAVIPVDETERCDSGFIRTTGTLNDDGTGTLTANFSNCRFGNETVSGQVTLTIRSVFPLPLIDDVIVSFSSLTFKSPTFDVTASGSIHSQIELSGGATETLTVDLVTQDNNNDQMTKTENLVLVIEYNSLPVPSFYSESITGRVFDSVHGFVDITTPASLFFGTIDQEFPDSGQLVLTGDNNASIRVTVLSMTFAMLELDLDGDSAYELLRVVQWVQLPTEDLDDSDGDGMHNSWEDENGFDPLDPSDATEDPDGDSFSNLQEYENATDPSLNSSIPLAANLSITMTDSIDPVATRADYRYELSIVNSGAADAINVLVLVTLPPGVGFVSASGHRWNCSHLTGAVGCSRNIITSTFNNTSSITINVTAPTGVGVLSSTATITTDTIVPDLVDNTASEDTEIIPAVADLSINVSVVESVRVDTNYVFQLGVTNLGPDRAENVRVQDTLPPGVSFVHITPPSPWGCSHIGGTITCTRNNLSTGPSSFIIVTVTAPSNTGVVSNAATVSSDTIDPDLSNNSDTEETEILPPNADLSITQIDSSDPIALGGNLTYSLSVTNHGPDRSDVVVTDVLPSGVTLDSVTPSIGSCSGTSTLTCDLGTVEGSATANVTVVVTGTTEGIAHNRVSVAGSLPDFNPFNDGETITTTIGTLVTGLQAQIDAANPGDTILVGPGIYLGGLDFAGKDISLESTSGTGNTIIHGNSSETAVTITVGPRGAVRGFTITGGRASLGSGIRVNGQDTVIADNVFDGNRGSSGSAIHGDGSSPAIEENIFRNNFGKVVNFLGDSSPTITNNVFDSNPATGLDFALPIPSRPHVVNNTFIDNRVGVHIFRGTVSQATLIFRNNVIVNNRVGLKVIFGSDGDDTVWENNLVFGNVIVDYEGITDQTGTNGNISSDPLFVDALAGDYHLQTGSPAIDAGSSVDAPADDFDGTVRPLDGDGDTIPAVDIGAFEAPAL